MKRIICLFLAVLLNVFILPNSVNAKELIEISNLELVEKSDTSIINNESYSDLTIFLGIKFNNADNYAKYKITLHNNDNKDYLLSLEDEDTDYIEYSYDYDQNLSAGKNTEILLTVKYNSEAPREKFSNGKIVQQGSIKFILNENEVIGTIETNPPTSDNLSVFISIAIISLIILIALMLRKNKQGNKIIISLLVVMLLMSPKATHALETLAVNINTNIEIIYTCDESKIYKEATLNGAYPDLDSGMIPVEISDDGSLTKADLCSDWYSYENKSWANVVLVSDSSRQKYLDAESETPIELSDVMAYYVWIPRYRYQIFADTSNITVTSGINISKYEEKSQEINIIFENKDTEKVSDTTKGSWLTHPAFTFGDVELNGVWIAKFETTGSINEPTVLPSTVTLRGQKLIDQFTTSRRINYGIKEKDPAILKNTEWGAVAYLTNSKYGRCTDGACVEVSRNNNSNYLTGYSAINDATIGQSATSIPENEFGTGPSVTQPYNTDTGYKASTTGNITGVYDMSGGTWERVMGVVENAKGSNIPAYGGSGFTDSTIPESKYYDLYDYNPANNTVSAYKLFKFGDATGELANFYSWKDPDGTTRYHNSFYMDFGSKNNTSTPWVIRGGRFTFGVTAGIFGFDRNSSSVDDKVTFRAVIR